MKRRRVRFMEKASDDIAELLAQLASAAGLRIAAGYVDRLASFCERLDLAPERGHRRDDISSGLWTIGFERRVTIAFSVETDEVLIHRIFYGGRDWKAELSEE